MKIKKLTARTSVRVTIQLAVLVMALLPAVVFSQNKIPLEKLRADFDILVEAVQTIHPGLHKYVSPEAMQLHFDTSRAMLTEDLTLAEAFLFFSKFAAGIQCGHTHVGPWNQTKTVEENLYDRADKLPFTFRLVERRMMVEMDLSEAQKIGERVEIKSINGKTMEEIIHTMLPYIAADGGNDAMRLYEIQLTGLGRYEVFDVLFPLLFPPGNDGFELAVFDPKTETEKRLKVSGVTRPERFARMQKCYGPLPETYDDLWEYRVIDERVGYLKMGTFATFKMELNWKKFMADAFKLFEEKGVADVAIDIRGNGGGMDEVSAELAKYIVKKESKYPANRFLQRYERIPENLRPYLGTWDQSFYDYSGKVRPVENGLFESKKATLADRVFRPTRKATKAEVWLLIDAANSSATFHLANAAKANGMATLVGQPTGGNLKGTNGGGIFFLTLPHSQVEMDLPIFGSYPLTEQPDRGVEPDILVVPTMADFLSGRDVVLERVMEETK